VGALGTIGHFVATAATADALSRGIERGVGKIKKRKIQKGQKASKIVEDRTRGMNWALALRRARPVIVKSTKHAVKLLPDFGVALGAERAIVHLADKDKQKKAMRAKTSRPKKVNEVAPAVAAGARAAGSFAARHGKTAGKFILKHGKKAGQKASEIAKNAAAKVKASPKAASVQKYGKRFGKDVAIFTAVDQVARGLSNKMDASGAAKKAGGAAVRTNQAKSIVTAANDPNSFPVKPGYEKNTKPAWQPKAEFNATGGVPTKSYSPRTDYVPDAAASNPKTAAQVALMRSGQVPSAPNPTKSKVLVSKQANATRKGGAKREDIEEYASAIAGAARVASVVPRAIKVARAATTSGKGVVSAVKTASRFGGRALKVASPKTHKAASMVSREGSMMGGQALGAKVDKSSTAKRLGSVMRRLT
jgi:hypothetical protein